MNARTVSEQIFRAGVQSVLPGEMIRRYVSMKDGLLFISNLRFSLKEINVIYVIGAGKASALMAKEVESILGDIISEGHIVVKYGHSCDLKRIKVSEAAHPIPDENGLIATRKVVEIAHKATEKDLVICLLSGGGSALLIDCPEGITLFDIITLNNLLLKSGADIREMNTVRKHLSDIKGGGLSGAVYPGILISLILSDVTGDPLDIIASGPSVPDPTTYEDAMTVLRKYKLLKAVPVSITRYLKKRITESHSNAACTINNCFTTTHNFIIGSNKKALQAAYLKAIEFKLTTIIVTDQLKGNLVAEAENIIDTATRIQDDCNIRKPVCLLYGGETTLVVKKNGLGGRNQHLALYSSLLLRRKKGITLLSAGTDGNDGPTDAAGAVVDFKTSEDAVALNLDIETYLEQCNSFHFFDQAGGHVITGPTLTNVMDLIVVIVEELKLKNLR